MNTTHDQHYKDHVLISQCYWTTKMERHKLRQTQRQSRHDISRLRNHRNILKTCRNRGKQQVGRSTYVVEIMKDQMDVFTQHRYIWQHSKIMICFFFMFCLPLHTGQRISSGIINPAKDEISNRQQGSLPPSVVASIILSC